MTAEKTKNLLTKPILYGICGGLSLLLIYFSILSIANSLDHAWDEFVRLWYWIFILVFGFGIQIGLYVYVREFVKLQREKQPSSSMVAASGGVSTVSMIACCAHHLAEVLPLIGLSTLALVLNEFQLFFILIGVFSNFLGITMMLKIIQKHHYCFEEKSIMGRIMFLNLKKTMYAISSIAIFTLLIVFYYSLI